jgi:allantoin racemase
MRIWHQSFTELSRLPAYAEGMKSHAARILRPDTEVVWHGQLPGTYPGNYPGDDIGYGPLFAMHGLQWVAAARQAQAEGFDAFAMCTLPNPMLRECRAIVDIPVIGLGEATFHLASMLGQRFGVMMFIDRMVPLYQEQIAAYGLQDRCAVVRKAEGITFQDVLAGYTDPAPAIAKFETAARAMIRNDRADVIVPGEVPLSLLLARNGVSRIDGVPIMDTLACCLKMAEMMVDLKRTTGIWQSREGFFNAAPSKARMDEVAAFYGLDKLQY